MNWVPEKLGCWQIIVYNTVRSVGNTAAVTDWWVASCSLRKTRRFWPVPPGGEGHFQCLTQVSCPNANECLPLATLTSLVRNVITNLRKGRKHMAVIFWNLLLYFRVEPISNVVIVSGGQQGDPAICIYIYTHTHLTILAQSPLPSSLPHNIEQSSLCYTVGSSWLFIFKYSGVYMLIPNSLTIPSPILPLCQP